MRRCGHPRRLAAGRSIARLALILPLAAIGCARAGSAANQAPQAAPRANAPLKLCPVADTPPAELAARPGYAQFTVSVTDQSGEPIAGLKQSDFSANRAGQSLPIQFFRDGRDAPVSLAILLDASGSMEEKLGIADSSKLQSVRKALADVVSELNACDEVAVLSFGGRQSPEPPTPSPGPNGWRWSSEKSTAIRLLQPWTTDHQLALGRLTDLVPYGKTPLYDSIDAALQVLVAADYPIQVLVVITDGMDTSSKSGKEDALAQAHQSGVPIYAVGIGDPDAPDTNAFRFGPFALLGHPDERVDAETLKAFSDATGGRTFVVTPIENDTGEAFINALRKIAGILRQSYAIGLLMPAGSAGEAPTVAVTDRPDAVVRLRRTVPNVGRSQATTSLAAGSAGASTASSH